VIDQEEALARRLARYRVAVQHPGDEPPRPRGPATQPRELAARLAEAVGGEVRSSAAGSVVWCQARPHSLPLNRDRLAALPGQPPPAAPLICLDTETTGLATAAGTVAFLVGLGWWNGDAFQQVQLLVPDHADESAMLATLAALIPPNAWLVTYNGRSFDWPLLVARYRLHGSPAPAHAGHVDLLPIVRRLFRHRMADARLRTAEEHLLDLRRHGDVDGWEIPGRYLGFLHGGSAEPLVEVVRHNTLDVRSLARLLGHLERGLGDRRTWRSSHPGDLAGLARSFARQGRLADALECLDIAIETPLPPASPAIVQRVAAEADWWSPRAKPDFGGRLSERERSSRPDRTGPWTDERIAIERARLQRRAGDRQASARSWALLLNRPGRTGIVAAIELAKLHEHQFGDLRGALRLAAEGLGRADRRRRLGRPEHALERDLRRRTERLRRRLLRVEARGVGKTEAGQGVSSGQPA
jgi:RNase_H superfamily